MPIAPDSTSYPYLALAQQIGVDYGTVLSVLDGLENGRFTRADTFQSTHLSGLITLVHARREREMQRRARVLAEARS